MAEIVSTFRDGDLEVRLVRVGLGRLVVEKLDGVDSMGVPRWTVIAKGGNPLASFVPKWMEWVEAEAIRASVMRHRIASHVETADIGASLDDQKALAERIRSGEGF